MKYKRLTKEQFEELHQEFSTFLATQKIDHKEWSQIKEISPEIAEQELDVFSDLIWEKVLKNCTYLEHFSKSHIFLFHCQELEFRSIIIKSNSSTIDLMEKSGLQWLSDNMFTDNVELIMGKKKYNNERELSIFQLICQGAILSDGQLYNQVNGIVNK